jgi:hypothetical protein
VKFLIRNVKFIDLNMKWINLRKGEISKEDDTIEDHDNIMQIKSTLTNKIKMQTKNPKEENEEVPLTQNIYDNDEYSITYQLEELSNGNL